MSPLMDRLPCDPADAAPAVAERTMRSMTYEQLPIVEADLTDVLLDLDNYRIPTRSADEAAALLYLFSSEDVLDAARTILRNGYFDNEIPVVFSKAADGISAPFVVLEGNRRVSALKAMLDPTIVPSHQAEISGLLKRFAVEAQDLPARIRIMVAPDREHAAPYIARLHTGDSKKRWTLDQQANYYYSLLASMTAAEVKASYLDVNVPRLLKMGVMRRFVSHAPFADKSLRTYAKSGDLKMSSFEYAFKMKDIADEIGVSFGSDGLLVPAGTKPDQAAKGLPAKKLAALEVLLSEFRSGVLNTRSPELKKGTTEHAALLARMRGETPDPDDSEDPDAGEGSGGAGEGAGAGGADAGTGGSSGAGKGTDGSDADSGSDGESKDDGGSEDQGDSSSDDKDGHGPNHPDTKSRLDFSGIDFQSTPPNLKKRYFELKRIDVVRFPIAAAMLMRSVLESTVKIHFEATTTPVTGQLEVVLKQVEDSYGSNKAVKFTITQIRSGGVLKPGSIQWFNMMTHHADASPSHTDVRSAWSVVNPLLRFLLAPIASPPNDPTS